MRRRRDPDRAPRARLLERLESAWAALATSYEGLDEAAMTEPGVVGRWSVKDVVAHVTSWEEESLKHLPLVAAGRRPPRYSVAYGGIDAFNALTVGARAHLVLAEVLRHRDAVHRRLLAYLGEVPEEQLAAETRFRRRLRLDTYGHYGKHAEAIRRWRDRRATRRPAPKSERTYTG